MRIAHRTALLAHEARADLRPELILGQGVQADIHHAPVTLAAEALKAACNVSIGNPSDGLPGGYLPAHREYRRREAITEDSAADGIFKFPIGSPQSCAISGADQSQTEAPVVKSEVQPVRETPTPIAQVSQPDTRTTERQLKDERRRQADRKAGRIAAARAKQQIEAQTRREPRIMAFGGDGPNFFGN
jgi:hypothetical protein